MGRSCTNAILGTADLQNARSCCREKRFRSGGCFGDPADGDSGPMAALAARGELISKRYRGRMTAEGYNHGRPPGFWCEGLSASGGQVRAAARGPSATNRR